MKKRQSVVMRLQPLVVAGYDVFILLIAKREVNSTPEIPKIAPTITFIADLYYLTIAIMLCPVFFQVSA